MGKATINDSIIKSTNNKLLVDRHLLNFNKDYYIRLFKFEYVSTKKQHDKARTFIYKVFSDDVVIMSTSTYQKALVKYTKVVDNKIKKENEIINRELSKSKLNNGNNILKELIDFRLDNIHTVTIGSYKIVKDMIILAIIYNLEYEYINNIKSRFKHFRL